MNTCKTSIKKLAPWVEALERRELLSVARVSLAAAHFIGRAKVDAAAVAVTPTHVLPAGPLVMPAATDPSAGTFIDPTAIIHGGDAISIGSHDYIGPFATLTARRGATISIGSTSNVQDNVEISAIGPGANVVIGDQAILAHNATILGPATIGAPGGAPAFVGFNAIVDGATVQPGAMVLALAKVAPGIVIPTGYKVLPGKYVQTQAEADDPSLGKVEEVTDDDIDFMNDVIHVNESLAAGYLELEKELPSSVYGIGLNPPVSFNPKSSLPTLAGVPTADPSFRDRIIGNVQMTNSLSQLETVMGSDDSIRADEASPFVIGSIARMGNRVTIHGLETTNLMSGHGDTYGYHSVIHGGSDSGQDPEETTQIGSNVRIGAWAVVFRSTIGDNCVIGPYAYIDGSTLAPGTRVRMGAIIIDNEYVGQVEWI